MSKILIAFSTGPDSVYLYHYLKKQNHELSICYVNHKIRDDVDEDIKFAKEFSEKEGINLYIEELNLENFSEGIAREKRYEKLEKVRKQIGYDLIATGHNLNDNVETIIFRMIRGTGLEGLKGIPRKRNNIIRPILDVSKENILKFLEDNNIPYRIDYTNSMNVYSRNKIRNEIFPIMKEINTNFLDNISRLINSINEDEKIRELKEYIYQELKKFNISHSSEKIKNILDIKDKIGASISLNDKYIWYKTYNFYGIKERKESVKFNYNLLLGESIKINGYNIEFCDSKSLNLEKKGQYIYNIGSIKKVIIRNRDRGDCLDNKKIKAILINNKVDRHIRDEIPLICTDTKVLIIPMLKCSKEINKEIEHNSNYIVITK